MANTYKTFLDDDIVTTKTLLNEYIPITSSVVSSSTYLTSSYKQYSHGMFVTVYDYPINSSSANNLFDITFGFTTSSAANSVNGTDAVKKINMYNQMAQVLVGYDTTGSIFRFDRDGNPSTPDDKFNEMFFLNFSRMLTKDEIKKGSFNLQLGVNDSTATPMSKVVSIYDNWSPSNNVYKENSPTGEYGILYCRNSVGTPAGSWTSNDDKAIGFIFYQAGIAAISTNIFALSSSNSPNTNVGSNSQGQLAAVVNNFSGSVGTSLSTINTLNKLLTSGSINDICHAIRQRIYNIEFSNTTELNSTIHFCRINHNDFNYSSNPTYLSSSQIWVKNKASDAPVTYITTIGLYAPDNELLAVAKLSEPIKKDPTQELILRVRLDY